MRLPSMSYWPPWHGQPKPDEPKTRTGQPRCMQVFAIAVNSSLPSLRMKTTRRSRSVWPGARVNVTTWNGLFLSTGYRLVGPRSTSKCGSVSNAGAST